MFGAIVKSVSGAISRSTGSGGNSSGGGKLRVANSRAGAIARQQIIEYCGADYLGMAANLKLTVNSVAQLEDTKKYISEQRELITYAAQKIQQITTDVGEIEKVLSEIVDSQLKTRAEVDRHISKVNLAGDRYSASQAKLSQAHANQQTLIASATAGEMQLDNVATKLAMLTQKRQLDNKRKTMELNAQTAETTEKEAQTRREAEAKESAQRKHLITNGTGSRSAADSFTRFKSYI